VSPEVKYLRARYDEEEGDARTVPQYNGDSYGNDRPWVLEPQYDFYDHTRVLWVSPAHVLADLAAKRKILDLRESSPVVRALLQPYAGRDDFDQAWAELPEMTDDEKDML
jgi:hypothetical protein